MNRRLSATAMASLLLLLASTTAAIEPPIVDVTFTPELDAVVACSQAGLQVYAWPDLKSLRSLTTTVANPHGLAFSPSGDRLAIAGGSPGESGVVEILSWPEGQFVRVLEAHADTAMAVAWQDELLLASASLDHSIVLWNSKTGQPVRSLLGHSRGVTSLCFLRRTTVLVSGGIDQSLRVWETDGGMPTRSLSIHTQPIRDISARPGDHQLPMIASASEDKTVRLWQPTIGRMVRFARLASKPLNIDWLPDGSRIIASCEDGTVALIDPDTVEVTRTVPAIRGWGYALAVHPSDGRFVVGGNDGELFSSPVQAKAYPP